MKAVRIHSWGNVDVIKIDEVEMPTVKDGEVLVKVKAAGVNPIDWKVREGYFSDYLSNYFPFPMGWDFSGVVVSANKGAKFKESDEVFGLIRFFEPAGTFAEYTSAPISEISHKPSNIDHLKASATPLVALTAWQALFDTAELQSHQTVLIHAAAGGVGQFAVQFAKWKGAKVIAVASGKTRELLTSYGVDQFVDYQSEQFENITKNVDVVLNLVGDVQTAVRSLEVMNRGGKILSFLGPHSPEVVAKAQKNQIDTLSMIVKPNGTQLENIAHLIQDGLINITLEKVFPLDEVKLAMNHVQAGHCHGKVVLKISS